MHAGCRNIAPSDLAQPADGDAFVRPRRPVVALRVGVVAAAVTLAGCAGMPGTVATPAESAGIAVQNPAAPFAAAVNLVGAPPARFGDPVSFVLSAGTEGFGHLYLLNTSGTVVALAENLSIAPDAPMLFPAPDAGFTIHARPPAGINRVLLLVTRQPFPGFGGGGAGAPPEMLATRADAFVAQLNASTTQLSGNDWSLAETRVEVLTGG